MPGALLLGQIAAVVQEPQHRVLVDLRVELGLAVAAYATLPLSSSFSFGSVLGFKVL